ncbi:MAG: Ig domain-containing protein [Planctomycetota bacterium]
MRRLRLFPVPVLLLLLTPGCLLFDDYSSTSESTESTNCYITSTKAVVNQWFSADLSVYSTYIETVEYSPNYSGTLPTGISFDSYSGTFSGTPTEKGFYEVKVYYRDPDKGTYTHPNLVDDMWYYKVIEFEVSRFKQPEGGGVGYVKVENSASVGLWVYVDGEELGWVNPNGGFKNFNVRAGMRAFQYKFADGTWDSESIYEVLAGQSYTLALNDWYGG